MPPRSAAKTATSAAALGYDPAEAALARPKMTAGAAGDAASAEALARIDSALRELKAMAAKPLLEKAIEAIRAEDAQAASDWALKGLEKDEQNGFGWYLLGIAREKAGDFASSIRAYESALRLIPDHGAVANDLGRLAYRLGMKETAEKLFLHFIASHPDSEEGANNLACAVRDQGRFEEAIEILRPAIVARPDNAILWNTLGSVVAEQGDPASSITFFDEALRLDPGAAKARYNRGNARVPLGDLEGALEDCERALRIPVAEPERQMMLLARSTIQVARGELGRGWEDYEARLHPQFADVTHFMVDRPQWTPDADLAGKTLLVVGEQGLGDEVLFANLLPDVVEALGPEGRLLIAVEPRLVPLFQRAFPSAEVGAHATYTVDGHCVRGTPFVHDQGVVDLWVPMASLLRRFRPSVEAFPARERYMRADPARVAHWKAELDRLPGRKVGVVWKSLKLDRARARFFSLFHQWAPVLRAPGVTIVNLQYGDCAPELAIARTEMGVDIWDPPGIDLKQDLDDVAALSSALDLVIGPANATTNIAAACGAPVWLISTPGAWPRLGTDRYPWYPQARVFLPEAFGEWSGVMAQIAAALAED